VDFRFAEDVEDFRAEVRAFLGEVMAGAPEHMDPTDLTGLDEGFERAVHRRAALRGWFNLPADRRYVFECEAARAAAPLVDTAVVLAGHAVSAFGSDHLRAWLLPLMLAGEVELCIAYSEEDAGSDLTGIGCRATRTGPASWALRGRKAMVTGAHKADWCLTVARTGEGPGRSDLTMFLVDMHDPAVRVERRPTMNGWTLDDIAFDGVEVPDAHVLGGVGAGWRQMASAVAAERSGASWIGFAHQVMDLIVDYVRQSPDRQDPVVRDLVARCAVEVADVDRLSRRALWTAAGVGSNPSEADPVYPAMVKVAVTELLQHLAQAATEIAGLAGLVWASPFDPEPPPSGGAGGRFAWEYLERVHGTISVGANEVQRDAIARIGLGLPRRGA
jgi:alkylation response protein AidB-like acyl-CoA dehydrogenase